MENREVVPQRKTKQTPILLSPAKRTSNLKNSVYLSPFFSHKTFKITNGPRQELDD